MKYIVDFDTTANKEQERGYSLSGTNKALYIAQAIAESLHDQVEIVSPALTKKKNGYVRAKTYTVAQNVSVKLFSTFGCHNKIFRGLRYCMMLLKLIVYLTCSVKKDETILAYHEMKLAWPLLLLKRIKKFKLILEVEEIYSDVLQYSARQVKNEYEVIRQADGYLFSTDSLRKKLQLVDKPYVLIYGTYTVPQKRDFKFSSEDRKTHCVYSGTFDPTKGGAYTAVEACSKLDDDFCLHVLGFGTQAQIQEVKKLIDEKNRTSQCKIVYEGKKEGKEFTDFLQACDIGLSTQNPSGTYNDTSFPSKILTYMSCGLTVVSVSIPVVEQSAVGADLILYDGIAKNDLVRALLVAEDHRLEGRSIIERLDLQFRKSIRPLFKNNSLYL